MGGAVGVPVPEFVSSAGAVGPVSTVLNGIPLCAVAICSVDCIEGVAPGKASTLSGVEVAFEFSTALNGIPLCAVAICSGVCAVGVTPGKASALSGVTVLTVAEGASVFTNVGAIPLCAAVICSCVCASGVTPGRADILSGNTEAEGASSTLASAPIVVVVFRSAAISGEVLDASVGRVAAGNGVKLLDCSLAGESTVSGTADGVGVVTVSTTAGATGSAGVISGAAGSVVPSGA